MVALPPWANINIAKHIGWHTLALSVSFNTFRKFLTIHYRFFGQQFTNRDTNWIHPQWLLNTHGNVREFGHILPARNHICSLTNTTKVIFTHHVRSSESLSDNTSLTSFLHSCWCSLFIARQYSTQPIPTMYLQLNIYVFNYLLHLLLKCHDHQP